MNVEQGIEGKPVIFSAVVQVRPEVVLGDYRNFNFKPEIEPIDDAKVAKVVEELRDQNATPRAGRGSRRAERRLRGHRLHRDAGRRRRSRAAARSACRSSSARSG